MAQEAVPMPQSAMVTLVPGDLAPSFALPSTRGVTRTLQEYLAGSPVLLAFHRGHW